MPVIGSEYEVIREAQENGYDLYVLAGFPSDAGYVRSGFATLPSATDDEMQEEEFIHEPFSC